MVKTVREQIQANESAVLSQYAMLSANTKGRKKSEPECSLRTPFQRDRDRIIHCKAFRRLKHKTQVFLAPEGDHYRTRLTHTLEVAQIARTIARALALNEDLTEAVALGHDLGHTPFGHAGEHALDEIHSSGFKHYEQSVRVLERLEKDGEGLNLTYEVLNGILCHTCGKEAATLEGRIVRISDKIAYINHDIDDAVRAGVLREDSIPGDIRRYFGCGISQRINTLVTSVVENSKGEIRMDEKTFEYFQRLHSFMFENVYFNPVCKSEEGKAQALVKNLYGYFLSHPQDLPEEYSHILEEEGANRATCDYIAGMTDCFALEKYKDLFIPKSEGE